MFAQPALCFWYRVLQRLHTLHLNTQQREAFWGRQHKGEMSLCLGHVCAEVPSRHPTAWALALSAAVTSTPPATALPSAVVEGLVRLLRVAGRWEECCRVVSHWHVAHDTRSIARSSALAAVLSKGNWCGSLHVWCASRCLHGGHDALLVPASSSAAVEVAVSLCRASMPTAALMCGVREPPAPLALRWALAGVLSRRRWCHGLWVYSRMCSQGVGYGCGLPRHAMKCALPLGYETAAWHRWCHPTYRRRVSTRRYAAARHPARYTVSESMVPELGGTLERLF
eukprot:PhM_4_TR13265/c0_g1_i1/m.48539